MANIGMLKSCHVVNSSSSSCLLLAKNADQRKNGWNDQQTSLATCMTKISELGLVEQCSSPGSSDRKCQKMCLRRRIQRLYCLDEWIILISISELSQEVGRICMLRTGLKGSAVDFLQVGTTTYLFYYAGILLCAPSVSNFILKVVSITLVRCQCH